MKTFILIASIFITSTMLLMSNEKSPEPLNTTIAGQVVDKYTGEALAGVKIILNETDIVVYTDLDGKFEIGNIKQGNNTIETNFISYNSSVIDIDCDNDTSNIEIELMNK